MIIGAIATRTRYLFPMLSQSLRNAPPDTDAKTVCIFLDFDGTLVPIAQRPEDVTVNKALAQLLKRLHDVLDRRLAVVSGRSLAQLDALFGTSAQGLTLVGSHGAELRIGDNAMTPPARPEALDRAEASFRRAFEDRPGIVIEVKSFGVAIHYRLDPEMEETVLKMATDFEAESDLEIQRGKMVVELRTSGHDKGSAIKSLLLQSPFAGYAPIFIGDDLTDEAAFEACASEGGFGVLVGPPRETAAHYRFDDVAAVHQWLETL